MTIKNPSDIIVATDKRGGDMFNELTLSTDNVEPGDTAQAWRNWLARMFHGLQADLFGDTVFDGHIQSAQAGTVVMARMQANRHRVLRTPESSKACEADYLKIVAPWQGCAEVEQRGRKAWVGPGSWAIYDTTGSYEVNCPERSEYLIVMLPKHQLIERGLRFDDLMGRDVGGSSGISRLALETMRNTFQELPRLSRTAACGVGDMIIELVRHSLINLVGKSTSAAQQETFKDRIRAYIGAHLRNPDLSISEMAAALNCSRRHLYNAFGDETQSLAHYILHRRLQECMRDLKNPTLAGQTITEIAFSWGFSNMAYFSRVFREHISMSPTDFRSGREGVLIR